MQRLCSGCAVGGRGLGCLTCDVESCGLLCLHLCRSLNGMTGRRSATQTAINRWTRLNLRYLRSLRQFWLPDAVKTTTTGPHGSLRMNGNRCPQHRTWLTLASCRQVAARRLLPRPMFVCTVSPQCSGMQTAEEQEKEPAVAKNFQLHYNYITITFTLFIFCTNAYPLCGRESSEIYLPNEKSTSIPQGAIGAQL